MAFDVTVDLADREVRLFPSLRISSDGEAEQRATAALLAVIKGVTEFGRAIAKLAGGPAGRISNQHASSAKNTATYVRDTQPGERLEETDRRLGRMQARRHALHHTRQHDHREIAKIVERVAEIQGSLALECVQLIDGFVGRGPRAGIFTARARRMTQCTRYCRDRQ